MTSACLWFHGKLSGGNRRGKELLSLCTQGKKNPVGPHVRRGWRVVACVRGKSKEWFQRNELAFLSCGSQFLSFSCDPPESQRGPFTHGHGTMAYLLVCYPVHFVHFFWEVRVHSPCPEKQPVWRFLQLLCLCIVGVTLRSPIRISNYPYTQPSSMCYFSESLTVGGIVLVWKCPQIQHEESMILGLVYYPLCNTILANRTVL